MANFIKDILKLHQWFFILQHCNLLQDLGFF